MKRYITIICLTLISTVSNYSFAQGPVVDYPNGGEVFNVGEVIDITWSNTPVGTIVGIDYTIDNWTNTIWLDTYYQNNSENSYSWTIPNTPGTQCKVGIFDTNFDGDISDNFFTIQNTAAINETEQEFTIALFPNPAQDFIIVAASNQDLSLEMFDLTGSLVEVLIEANESGNYRISRGDLTSGVYILRVSNNITGGSTQSKIRFI